MAGGGGGAVSGYILLSDLCVTITKGTTPNEKDGGFSNAGINYIKSESLSYDGSVDHSKFAFISAQTNEKLRRSKIQNNDILYSIAGANLGKCGMARKEHLPANTNQAVAIIRADPQKASPRFISFCLRDPKFVQSVLGGVAQSAQPNVNLAEIGRFRIPNLPVPNQRAIAATLGALDDKIELNRKMNATLEAMARALFRDWFVDFGPTRAKMAGEAPYLSPTLWPLFPDRLDDAGKPEGWEVGAMSDLFTLQRGFDLPSQDRREGHYPILAASGPSGFHEIYMVKGPGVTTGRSGVLGRVFYVHGDFWPLNTSLWINDFKRATPLYAYYFLNLIDLAGFNAGSAVPTLNRNHIHGLPAVLPPRELIAAFDRLADSLMKRHRQNEIENETLAQTRDLLLPRLMSGELRVVGAERMVEAVL